MQLKITDHRHSQPITEEETERMKELAGDVLHNQHLAQVLKGTDHSIRRDVYNLLRPHLKFKAKPYCLLAKAWTH